MFILGSNIAFYEAKQKPVWVSLATACVCMGWKCIFMCQYVCDEDNEIICTYDCVCAVAAMSGDFCCVAGWELSAVGSRSFRLRRWKQRSQTGLVRQDTLTLTTHKYKVTYANYTEAACTGHKGHKNTWTKGWEKKNISVKTVSRETKNKATHACTHRESPPCSTAIVLHQPKMDKPSWYSSQLVAIYNHISTNIHLMAVVAVSQQTRHVMGWCGED